MALVKVAYDEDTKTVQFFHTGTSLWTTVPPTALPLLASESHVVLLSLATEVVL